MATRYIVTGYGRPAGSASTAEHRFCLQVWATDSRSARSHLDYRWDCLRDVQVLTWEEASVMLRELSGDE